MNRPMNRPMSRPRRVLRAFTGLAGCTVATLLMWRVLDLGPLLLGTAAGIGGGALAGMMLGRRQVILAARLAVAAAAIWGSACLAAGTWRGPLETPDIVTTFLTVGLPAAGLHGLALVAWAVALPAAALTVWGALGGRAAAFIGGPTAALLAASLLAAPRGVPIVPVVVFGALLAASILLEARAQDDALAPLLPGVHRPRRSMAAAAGLTALVAVMAGAALTAVPRNTAFDLRRYVHPRLQQFVDENPLAHAARLQVDPPDAAAAVDATVTVDGPSPGRLRVAVLDLYTPEGWHQLAGFGVTGRRLTPGGIVRQPTESASDVTVIDGPGGAGLRGVPTGGLPSTVEEPDQLLYAAAAGILLAPDGNPAAIRYRTTPQGDGTSATISSGDAVVPLVPAPMFGCPASAVIKAAAATFANGSADPVQRLRSIESWLKLKRIYDPRAPGGQTLGSVEQFIGLDMSRGNMEAFVTAAAVLALCAGVPVRVVVGYPAPAANAVTPFRASQITAWIEVPLARQGWVALDPVPTPEEQLRQAELAQQLPPTSADTPPAATRPPVIVEPVRPAGPATAFWRWLLWALGAVIAIALIWLVVAPRLVRARRRRTASPPAAVIAGWNQVTDRLADAGVPLRPQFTPSETAAATSGYLPERAGMLIARLGSLTDHARYDAGTVGSDHAGWCWLLVDEIEAHIPRSFGAVRGPVVHPVRWTKRLMTPGNSG